jgi:DNA-binding LytR/AlgR family response regulator
MSSDSRDFGLNALLLYLHENKLFILYCVSDDYITYVRLDNDECYTISANIGEIEKQDCLFYLFRNYKSMLLNVYCIIEVDYKYSFILIDNDELFYTSVRALKRIKACLRKNGFSVM